MKDKLDKYLDLAKEVHLANVPYNTPEAESLLSGSGRGTAQNFVDRFLNFFGRHLFMTITSLIAIILSGIYLLSPFGADEKMTEKKQESTFTQSKAEIHSNNEKSNLIGEDITLPSNEQLTNNNMTSDTTKKVNSSNDKIFSIDEINWELLTFNIENWSFMWTFRVESKSVFSKDGNHNIMERKYQLILEDKYLITVSKQLEDSLRNIVDLQRIKSICFLDVPDYFDKLTELNNELIIQSNNMDLVRMLNMYAHITRKLFNNPTEMMKIKSKGLLLGKEILEKLDIVFSDTTFSIPQDELYLDKQYINKFLKLYGADKFDLNDIPDKNILMKKNVIFEWEKVDISDDKTNILWKYGEAPVYQRISMLDKSSLYDDLNTSPENKKAVLTQSYFKIDGLNSSDKVNRKSPVMFKNWTVFNNHDAILYYGNEKTKKIYDLASKFELLILKLDSLKSLKSKNSDEINTINNELNTIKIYLENLKNSVKYRYLIPVDVQIPYYGFTKEELDTMPNATFVTLWYYPNEEFLSALPDDIRKQLEKEMKLVESVRKGELQPEDACDEIKLEESLLGLCNLTSQAITNLNVFPNPALDYVNIKFDLLDKRFYKIILTDASGQYLKDLSGWTESGKNEIKVIVSTSGLQSGAYVIQVVTEKSEKLMSKFVVKR
ncbi:MAG: T9SS type A sorting domain-containing protein [Candidatus Kapabacteria bacterium]|nr:T9SS type A sorting domain-containing protein [Ignavibacteriota bacterium]MCW5883343.1 T9SS type A sorting domain-containing protein [Candidatus Kapabacteria bacterium]